MDMNNFLQGQNLIQLYIKYKEYFRKNISSEEIQLFEDAKSLIKSVDSNIQVQDFSLYKISQEKLFQGFFHKDKTSNEFCIFFSSYLFLDLPKDFSFESCLHEVLHCQNFRKYEYDFDPFFLEGLNQFFTEWLIKNYSKKYEHIIVKTEKGFLEIYPHEVNFVEKLFNDFKVDIKEAFLNYIDFNPDFYEDFVPYKYWQ